jgi:hypothetical protein
MCRARPDTIGRASSGVEVQTEHLDVFLAGIASSAQYEIKV